jgi:DNA topoisomerase VI subunit B
MTLHATAPRLIREVFHTSRLLEFCSQKELVAQTGHAVEDWPLVIVKELVDNGLDSAEEHDIAPVVAIGISTVTGEIIVTDNGPGITIATVDGILDYTVRVSSREAYPSPSRGRQGNALKTLLAIPFVLDGSVGETVIEAQGITHLIRFSADPIRQEPRVCCERGSSTVKNGTRVTVRLPTKACHLLDGAARFLPFVREFGALNPHLAITLDLDGTRVIEWNSPTNPQWQKWKPSDPIPAHWHTPESLQRYMAACVNRDFQQDGRVRSIRDFLGGFRGLSSTEKRSSVLDETGLFRAPLDDLFAGGRVDHAAIAGLLTAMRRHSSPVKPQALGLIGKDHFRRVFETDGADPESFKYCRMLDTDYDGLPFVVEVAFAPASTTSQLAGVNWSAAIVNPFRSLSAWQSLDSVLREQHVRGDAPVLIAVHLACPVVQFADRGKSSAALSSQQSAAVIDAVRRVTKAWSETWAAEEREWHRKAIAAEQAEQREQAEWRKAAREMKRHAETHRKEIRAEERRRQRAATVGTGALYREIAAAANGDSLNALTVLSPKNDPYRLDTTKGHANGKWFADQIAKFPMARDLAGKIHLRGLFYCIVASADVKRPDGSFFINDDRCSRWLQNEAAKAARWLGYVPFDRIRDERNERPTVILPCSEAEVRCSFGVFTELPKPLGAPFVINSQLPKVVLPDVEALLPEVELSGFERRQPYRIILFGEKSSLAHVLAPLAARFNTELILPTGETSDTLIFEMAQRAAEDDRPAVVLYFSDFDPAGWQMPISVSRKLQALKLLHFPTLDLKLQRVALTIEQVREHNLPASPLKKTEKRAPRWKEHWGHEQTEIDALAALRPDVLRNIATTAILPFYDGDLNRRVNNARDQYVDEVSRRLREHSGYEELRLAIEETDQAMVNAVNGVQEDLSTAVEEVVARMRPELDRVHEQQSQTMRELHKSYDLIRQKFSEIRLPEIDIPKPEIDEDRQPVPVFTTADDFVTASLKLIAEKKYEGAEGEDDDEAEADDDDA